MTTAPHRHQGLAPRLLIDLTPIKTGGGAQLALNFLDHIEGTQSPFAETFIVFSDRFPSLEKYRTVPNSFIAPSTPFQRFLYEHQQVPNLIRTRSITHVYTFFGAGLPATSKALSLVGVAYPIICYDESPFWKHLPLIGRIRIRLKALARRSRLRRADGFLFESEIMRNRCVQALPILEEKTFVLPPTPTSYLKPCGPREDGKEFRFLFLCGLDPHKNLWRLPNLIQSLSQSEINCRFYVSVNRTAFMETYKVPPDQRALLDRYFNFLGRVDSNQIQSVYEQIDAVVNLSDLESFSNNYMEAWIAGKPLLVSDRDFSRAACGPSAYYTEPHDADALFNAIRAFSQREVDIAPLLAEGRKRLSALPSIDERVRQLNEILLSL